MNKDVALQYIISTMNLRTPQAKSLTLFAEYLSSPQGEVLIHHMKKSERKSVDDIEKNAQEYFGSVPESKLFESFDGRAYPTFTYALATGVGKTRLMGAFVAYLYFVHGIQHFLVVAPGNTIYRKLVDDFSKSANPKYVFKGFEELTSSNINIVTKDNYERQKSQLFANKIEINILNVQQFAQKGKDKEKGITKFNEVHGESYFDYLTSLDDLVVLLDEAHHYHADAAFESLDRLAPLCGLEFTATPYTGETVGRGKDKKQAMKKSIIHLYNLGDAIRDGYVKTPWIGTEADTDFKSIGLETIEGDLRKLQLAVHFHERAKTAIKLYASESSVKVVKPVMLIVAQNTAHASELKQKIDSDSFHGGAYRGKVLEIHTSLKGDESEEAIEKLVSLEEAHNYIEIIIHVNMLKEGWDVSNIYTIVPLRSSAADTLTEQTIGRGLRLPYGERTGDALVDRVMIVAHENYSRIVEQAKHSDLIQPTNIETLTLDEAKEVRMVLEAKPVYMERIEEQVRRSEIIQKNMLEKAEEEIANIYAKDTEAGILKTAVEAKIKEYEKEIVVSMTETATFSDYHKQNKAPESVWAPTTLFGKEVGNEMLSIQKEIKKTMEERNIPIPRLSIVPSTEEVIFGNFDLNCKALPPFISGVNVLEQELQGKGEQDLFGGVHIGQQDRTVSSVTSFGSVHKESPENMIIAALVSEPLVDYDEQKDLLMKLAKQAVTYYGTFSQGINEVRFFIERNALQIAHVIYQEMNKVKKVTEIMSVGESVRELKTTLMQFNIGVTNNDVYATLASQVDTFSRNLIYTGFSKACHTHYKFDSSDEARFAYLLDSDTQVEDWLKPAPNQFEGLYWKSDDSEQHRYEPDFVVELIDEIVMVEIKPEGNIADSNVQAKKLVAEKYCEIVSKSIGKFGIAKPWRYKIVMTKNVHITSTIKALLGE